MSGYISLVLMCCLTCYLKTSSAQRFLPPPPRFLPPGLPRFRRFPPPFFRPNFEFPPLPPFINGLNGRLNGLPLNGLNGAFNGGLNGGIIGTPFSGNEFLNPPLSTGGVLGTVNNDILNTGTVLGPIPNGNTIGPTVSGPLLPPNTIPGPIPTLPSGTMFGQVPNRNAITPPGSGSFLGSNAAPGPIPNALPSGGVGNTPTFPIPPAGTPTLPVTTGPGNQNTVLTDPLTGSPVAGIGVQPPVMNPANTVPGIQFAGTNTIAGQVPGPTFPQTQFFGNTVPNTGGQQFATGTATNPFGLAGNTPSLSGVDGVATQVTSNVATADVNQDSAVLNAGNTFSNRFVGDGNTNTVDPATSGAFNSIGTGQFEALNSTHSNMILPRPGSCHASGCPTGQQCVFAERYPCPMYIYSLDCRCEPGCRVMNTFIKEGDTQRVDTCGNTCTCATEAGKQATGAARCTMLNCQRS